MSLKDTTLRSIIFGAKDVSVVPSPDGQMISAKQVDKTLFDSYEHVLKVMAQCSRAVYCDSGILREVVLDPVFGSADNTVVNQKITEIDNKYSSLRRTPTASPPGKEGRPMQSYLINQSPATTPRFGRYISSPSDFTFMFLSGSVLSSKIPFLQATDLVLSFKGSSTMKNFKHDLYSQFTPADLSTVMPPGTQMSTPIAGKNIVPASFVKQIVKNWAFLKQGLDEFKPTRLFVTGHSLGGAFATLFTFILAEARSSFPSIQSVHLVSFGAPTTLGDGARNTFNAHLDSGFVTLDRLTSVGSISKMPDIIPSIPVGFTHPGFQPLRTELFPEKKTGRAYHFESIRKVFQVGGVFGMGPEKSKYEQATKMHMPNKIVVPAYNKLVQVFAHAEYLGMTFLGALRLAGMKNPGFKSADGKANTFLADLFNDGINFTYVSGVIEPQDLAPEPDEANVVVPNGTPIVGARRTYRSNPHRRTNIRAKKHRTSRNKLKSK